MNEKGGASSTRRPFFVEPPQHPFPWTLHRLGFTTRRVHHSVKAPAPVTRGPREGLKRKAHSRLRNEGGEDLERKARPRLRQGLGGRSPFLIEREHLAGRDEGGG